MFKRFAALAALVVVCGLAMGQEAPGYILKDGVAEWRTTGKTLDEVWAAMTKVLMLMNWNISTAEKSSGILAAYKSLGKAAWTDLKQNEMPSVNIVVNVIDDSVEIMARWENPRNTGAPFISYKKDRKKFYDSLFSKLVEAIK